MANKKTRGSSTRSGRPKGSAAASGSRKPKPKMPKGGPRQRSLPDGRGGHVRNVRLDRICEAIGEEREAINRARRDEQGYTQGALQVMQQAGISVYRHAGVELSRIPGAEKLRVRMTKEQGDADESDLEPPEPGAGGSLEPFDTASSGGEGSDATKDE